MSIRNIKLTIEYDGTRYHGWQSPKKDPSQTVGGRIYEVLRRMTGEEIVLFCGEKTDAGVHAYQQTANFKIKSTISTDEIRGYLNHYLPLDIAVLAAEDAPERFHAELNAHSRVYEYHVSTGAVSDVFRRKYTDFRTAAPDIGAMEKAAARLLGSHDFRAFSAGKTKKSTTKEVYAIEISRSDPEISIMIEADSFLRQMPQKIIGALLAAGYGEIGPDQIDRILTGNAGAPFGCSNQALFLKEVRY